MKRFSLRLDDDLHEQVEADAKRNRRSMNAEIIWRVEHPQDAWLEQLEARRTDRAATPEPA